MAVALSNNRFDPLTGSVIWRPLVETLTIAPIASLPGRYGFIVGAGNGGNVGATVGAHSINLTEAQLRQHQHGYLNLHAHNQASAGLAPIKSFSVSEGSITNIQRESLNGFVKSGAHGSVSSEDTDMRNTDGGGAGNNAAIENRPLSLCCLYIQRVK